MKDQDLFMQRMSQRLHQNRRYARFYFAISRFKHDIGAKYVEFCSKILHWIIKTSRSSEFDAEKWLFCAKITSAVDLKAGEPDFRPYLYSQLAERWGLG